MPTTTAVTFERREDGIWVRMPGWGAAAPLTDDQAESVMRELLHLLPAENACTCGDASGPCDACQARAEALIGQRVRDSYGREWTVEDMDEKNNTATIGGGQYWAYLDDVEVIA